MIINHDFHLHTSLSLCASRDADFDFFINKAKADGLKKIAITNHLWDHGVDGYQGRGGNFYEVQNFEHIMALKPEIDRYNREGGDLKVLFGAEAEYSFENRRPALTPAVAEQLEVLLVPNSHTHLTMPKEFYHPYEKHAEYMIDAFMDIVNSDVARYITAIPHPFMAVCCPYDNRILIDLISDDSFKRCFSAAAEKGIALEINPNYLQKSEFESYTRNGTLADMYLDPAFRMLRIGKECGCKFTVGTDRHGHAGELDYFYTYLVAGILDLTEDDFHPLVR
jgi:histidinol phosphatase-like PHP family hydrolase